MKNMFFFNFFGSQYRRILDRDRDKSEAWTPKPDWFIRLVFDRVYWLAITPQRVARLFVTDCPSAQSSCVDPTADTRGRRVGCGGGWTSSRFIENRDFNNNIHIFFFLFFMFRNSGGVDHRLMYNLVAGMSLEVLVWLGIKYFFYWEAIWNKRYQKTTPDRTAFEEERAR